MGALCLCRMQKYSESYRNGRTNGQAEVLSSIGVIFSHRVFTKTANLCPHEHRHTHLDDIRGGGYQNGMGRKGWDFLGAKDMKLLGFFIE